MQAADNKYIHIYFRHVDLCDKCDRIPSADEQFYPVSVI